MIRGVIFDHDGTLVDSERHHYLLWATLLRDKGIEFAEEEYRTRLAGVPTRTNVDYLLHHYPAIELTAEELFARREQLASETFAQQICEMIEGALELVEWVAARQWAMAIASGASDREVARTLTQYKLDGFFPVVATRESVANPKPAPDVYRLAVEQLGLQPHECIAIEDSPTGLQSALAANLRCLVVQNNYSRGQDFTGATAVLDSMAEAREWLAAEMEVCDKVETGLDYID